MTLKEIENLTVSSNLVMKMRKISQVTGLSRPWREYAWIR